LLNSLGVRLSEASEFGIAEIRLDEWKNSLR
jgi:hypothetical protein